MLVGVPYERGASFGAGASQGPRAILACLDRQIELFERHTTGRPTATGSRIGCCTTSLRCRRSAWSRGSPMRCRRARPSWSWAAPMPCRSRRFGRMPSVERASDVTVLQIDAHLDLRDDDSDYNERDPSRYAHSCVIRRAHEMGFRTCGRDSSVLARRVSVRARRVLAGVRMGPRRQARSRRSSARSRPIAST